LDYSLRFYLKKKSISFIKNKYLFFIGGRMSRQTILETNHIEKKSSLNPSGKQDFGSIKDLFASHVFTPSIMEKMLPKVVYNNVMEAIAGKEKIKPDYADTMAVAMQEWAISHNATHFCHWFQPLTGLTAEKHDTFLEWKGTDAVIERFDGNQLTQGEPDASSFPSGGLRTTYEARGYTGWDPSSPVFLWKAGNSVTLCIPSVFFSWTGDALDNKIPLLRSDTKINDSVLRLLDLTGTKAQRVFSTLGWEQEYFIIDRKLRDQRIDLMLLGQTVYGKPSPKGQDLQDHYFGAVKERVLNYMQDFEFKALELGIPVKTRHNEVAPSQHELACIYEQASRSVDHNLLTMELMRRVAAHHGLACLLNEKPFQGLNGSGKHNNWSLATDTGLNLLDPSDTPENHIQFIILLTAVLTAVKKHAGLLRASVGSFSNDARLGGHEAPPPIISVYLGPALESVLDKIENDDTNFDCKVNKQYDLGIPHIPDLSKDEADRNRTSPFAFTSCKFEFRAVGSSASCAFPITVINSIVAQSLSEILDEIEGNLKRKKGNSKKVLAQASLPVIAKYLKASRSVRFSGDNYSQKWKEEASKREMLAESCSLKCFDVLTQERTIEAFKGVFKEHELSSRLEIAKEEYRNNLDIKVKLMIQIFQTQILPASQHHQKNLLEILDLSQRTGITSISEQKKNLEVFSQQIEQAIVIVNKLEKLFDSTGKMTTKEKNIIYADGLAPLCEEVRTIVDKLEGVVDDKLWPLPKYQELLFCV
jgi:glutamine synthetase